MDHVVAKKIGRKRRLAIVGIDSRNGLGEIRRLCHVAARRCMAAEGQVSQQRDKVWNVMYATATHVSAAALIARVESLGDSVDISVWGISSNILASSLSFHAWCFYLLNVVKSISCAGIAVSVVAH